MRKNTYKTYNMQQLFNQEDNYMQVPNKTCSYPEKYILSEIMTSNQKKALYLQNPAI